ncbi:MAG TPA: hypothetical protein VGF67_17080 [Ktedonobacteraceae bacterium]|jgi:hypothetical protein
MPQQNPDEKLRQFLAKRPSIAQLIQTEPVIGQLFGLAATVEDSYNRWQCYALLKAVGVEQYVGWRAKNENVRTRAAYDLFIEGIDLLLPTPELEEVELSEEEEEEKEAREQAHILFRDRIRQMFPGATLPDFDEEPDLIGEPKDLGVMVAEWLEKKHQ